MKDHFFLLLVLYHLARNSGYISRYAHIKTHLVLAETEATKYGNGLRRISIVNSHDLGLEFIDSDVVSHIVITAKSDKVLTWNEKNVLTLKLLQLICNMSEIVLVDIVWSLGKLSFDIREPQTVALVNEIFKRLDKLLV